MKTILGSVYGELRYSDRMLM